MTQRSCPAPQAPGRILYVDDEASARQAGRLLLARAGYAVDTAEDGQAAWEALRTGPYQLLITDNQMPRLGGLGLVRKLREARLAIPAIIASSTTENPPRADLAPLECAAVLPKPFSPARLLAVVQEILGSPGHEQAPLGGGITQLIAERSPLAPSRQSPLQRLLAGAL